MPRPSWACCSRSVVRHLTTSPPRRRSAFRVVRSAERHGRRRHRTICPPQVPAGPPPSHPAAARRVNRSARCRRSTGTPAAAFRGTRQRPAGHSFEATDALQPPAWASTRSAERDRASHVRPGRPTPRCSGGRAGCGRAVPEARERGRWWPARDRSGDHGPADRISSFRVPAALAPGICRAPVPCSKSNTSSITIGGVAMPIVADSPTPLPLSLIHI